MKPFKRWLREYLTPPPQLSSTEQRYYVVASAVFPIGAAIHVAYLGLFWWLNIPVLTAYNVAAVLIWVIALYAARHHKVGLALSLLYVEIAAHAVLCVLFAGWGFGFQYFMFAELAGTSIASSRRWAQIGGAVVYGLIFVMLSYQPEVWRGDLLIQQGLNFFNIMGTVGIILQIGLYYRSVTDRIEAALEAAHAKSEGLLLNVLPHPIAERLKQSDDTIADGFTETSVLFADIADFTPMSQRMTPSEVVQMLDDLFSRFDVLVRKHKLEKIKTIGDAYMVAAGVPTPRPDHAEVMAHFARDLREEVRAYNAEKGTVIQMRIGINSGPVVAGVIGKTRFLYDLWGDCVNTASRMESHGTPDEIQVSEATRALLDGHYRFEDRGEIDIKGKGLMRVYFLRDALPQPILETT